MLHPFHYFKDILRELLEISSENAFGKIGAGLAGRFINETIPKLPVGILTICIPLDM